MPDFTNIVTVDLTEATGYNVEAHRAVHQWDSGVILQLTGATFPQGTTCQFDTKTTTFNQELTDGACEIPNALLGYDMIGDIKAHIKIDDDDYGIVVYDIHIPVIRRPKPDSYIYTDNSSSSNGWIKSRYGYRVNEDQTILGRTELSINDNQTILNGTSLSLNNQQTVLDGTHLSLASGLFYADATHLQLNSGRITIGPSQLLVDSRVYGTVNVADWSALVMGGIAVDGTEFPATSYARSDFTKVKGSTTYTVSLGSTLSHIDYFWEYDENKALVAFRQYATTFTTASNTKYVRFRWTIDDATAFSPTDITSFQLEEGSLYSMPSSPFALDVVELTNRRFVQDWDSSNLFDPLTLKNGDWDGSNPAIRVNGQANVEGGKTYTFSVEGSVAIAGVVYLNIYGSLISWENSGANSFTFLTPANCYRIVIVFRKNADETITVSDIVKPKLVKGIHTISPFTPYSETIIGLTNRRFIQDFESKNIANSSDIAQGNISESSGAEVDSTTRVRSGYIAIEPYGTYTVSMYTGPVFIIALLYDSSLTFLDYKFLSGQSSTFSVNSSTAFVRFTMGYSDGSAITPSAIQNFQLEKGIKQTPYVPFSESASELSIRTQKIVSDKVYNGILYQATGAYCAMTQGFGTLSISQLLEELRYTKGSKSGSVAIAGSTNICPDGWYHFEYIPHRTGGNDNDNYQYILLRLTNFFDGIRYETNWSASGSGVVLQTMSTFYPNTGGCKTISIPPNSVIWYPMIMQPSNYGSYRAIGYLGGIGGIDLMLNITNGALSVYNAFDKTPWSATYYLNITVVGSNIKFETFNDQACNLVIIGG